VGLLLLGELWLALPFTAQLPLGQYVEPGSGQLDRLGLSDPVLYRTIMESGYERRPFSDDRQANWAFLPAWPLLWRAAAVVLPGDAAAVVLNVVLFSVGCVLVFVLLRHYLGEAAALLAAALLIVVPGAQFTVRPGPESLFLVASAGALLLAQRGRWWLVAPVVTLAALTRPQGWLLGVPLALIALQQLRQRWSPQQLLAVGVALLAPVVAVALFCAYLGRLTGNPFATFDIQRAWDNETAPPGLAILRSAKTLLVDHQLTDYYAFNLIPLSLAAMP
jgi:Gpi18-like mannosyltransferase